MNNISWYRNTNIINYLRMCKHISAAQMVNKTNTKNRIAKGMSFPEFSYEVSSIFI